MGVRPVEEAQMTTLQWVAVALVLLFVVFLMITFYARERLTDDQRNIVRFFSALCAGFAGGLITGEALFKLNTQIGTGTTLAISGTAGFALAFTVWFTFKPAPPPDAVKFSVPDGWTFRQAADALVANDNALIEWAGFKDEELDATLRPRQLQVKTIGDGLSALRHLTKSVHIRPYNVSFEEPIYRVTIKG
jgi:hypothetical protein